MFAWDQSFAVGIPHVDAQHKQLFGIVNELHQAMKSGQSKSVVGQTLEKLVAYTVTHFKDEEALMRRATPSLHSTSSFTMSSRLESRSARKITGQVRWR
jgi:hemerythrin-like metal-binding protein